MINVVSPTYGTINKVSDGKIQVYIHPTDNHYVYAPISGRITAITSVNGLWIHHIELSEFVADVKKVARVTIEINGTVSFWLEIGEGYITNRIHIYPKQGDFVEQGEVIGEIVLGSLSEIKLPDNANIKVHKEDYVIGGQTVIATL